MSQNAHPLVLSRGSGAGGTTGLGHSVINPPGSTTMNLSSSPSSVSWSHVNNGASASGASASTQQQQDAKTVPSPQNSNQSGTTLKEHDLLGLSEVSSSTTRGSQSPVQDNLSDEGSDFEELNLKMELGPPAARKISYPRSAPEQQQPAPVTSESGNSHGGSDGSLQTSEQGAAVVEKSSPNAEQNGAANEHQQQQVDRGLSYGAQGGRADAARPLIDSEALMKWHAEQVGDRKTSNEGVGGLRLGISLHSQRGATQDGVSEKKVFLNSTDRNREPEPKQQQEDTSWQQERSFQEDVPTMEKTQERPSVVQEQHQVVAKQQQQQQQQQQLERQKQQQHEAYNQMIEKRPLMERKSLPALQQPEQRFAQNVPERSPRLPPTEPANRLWSNQMKYRECLVSSTPDYQTQHSAQQDLDSRVGYSVSAGNFASNRNMYAGPKLGVTGAKRNFDAITGSDARNVNEARSVLPGPLSVAGGPMNTSNGPSSEAEAKALCQQQIKVQNGMPMYPWGQKNAIPTPSSWHMLEQSGGSFGPFPSQPQRPSRAPVSKNASEVISGAGVDTKTWDGQPKGHQEIVSTTPQQKMSAPTEAKQSTNDAAPAPPVDAASAAPRAPAAPAAVGWPPLRSFRKNLAVTPRPVPSETPSPRLNAPQQPAPAPSVAGQSNSWFVKVHMDGVPIGRKVDLRTNSSYDKLSQMLDEMFRSFVNGQNGPNRITLASDHKRNFLQGPDYVLTYEDQDGDLMLVGDVPWAMFIDTVKRLRIMKGSEAIGLGTRAAEKANKAPQPNV